MLRRRDDESRDDTSERDSHQAATLDDDRTTRDGMRQAGIDRLELVTRIRLRRARIRDDDVYRRHELVMSIEARLERSFHLLANVERRGRQPHESVEAPPTAEPKRARNSIENTDLLQR
jgi:hypothetical protein